MISQQINKNKKWIILAAVLLVLSIFAITTYNSLIAKQAKVTLNWDTLQATYQRRSDLLPSLVNVVQASANFEKTTLVQLSEIRSKAASVHLTSGVSGEAYRQLENEQAELANTTNRVLAVIESYPTLKSQTAFLRLQDQIKGSENRIRIARRDFNESVATYNRKVRSFPANIFAGMFGFKRKDGFQSAEEADKAPTIKFSK